MKKTEIRSSLLLIIGSLVFCLAMLVFGELLCRKFCDVPLLGVSQNLFKMNSDNTLNGNMENTSAVAFGVKVYTDKYGFRVPEENYNYTASSKKAVMILGDSVAFGPGIEEEKTFAGLLRKNIDSVNIYNSSVIGYNTFNYKYVVEKCLPEHNDVEKVFLIFCLNDINSKKVYLINNVLCSSNTDSVSQEVSIYSIRKVSIIRKLNQFLGPRSKLYLLLRHSLTDPQKMYWEADRLLYENEKQFLESLYPIVDIANILKNKNIDFIVIIVPYEIQLRSDDELGKIPQKKLYAFFNEKKIGYIDVFERFKSYGVESKKFFLPYDPMHLSEKGHEVIYEIIKDSL